MAEMHALFPSYPELVNYTQLRFTLLPYSFERYICPFPLLFQCINHPYAEIIFKLLNEYFKSSFK